MDIFPHDVDVLNNKGNALGKLGKYAEAIKYYEQAIKILKSNQSATGYSHLDSMVTMPIYNYIITNQNLNMHYIPISDLQNTPQDQTLIIAEVNLAKTAVKDGKYELAVSTYTEVLQSDPANGCALLGKAEALDKSGQHDEAVTYYNAANKLNPTCSTDTTNKPPKVDQPSQLGALVKGFSLLLSHH